MRLSHTLPKWKSRWTHRLLGPVWQFFLGDIPPIFIGCLLCLRDTQQFHPVPGQFPHWKCTSSPPWHPPEIPFFLSQGKKKHHKRLQNISLFSLCLLCVSLAPKATFKCEQSPVNSWPETPTCVAMWFSLRWAVDGISSAKKTPHSPFGRRKSHISSGFVFLSNVFVSLFPFGVESSL